MHDLITPTAAIAGFCRLNRLELIEASGSEASAFLHSQLTNDVASLTLSQARLAGYCTPKGRLLASLLIWKAAGDEGIVLELPAEQRSTFQKRLQMFIMRAKVTLTHTPKTIIGILGHSSALQLVSLFEQVPPSPYSCVRNENGSLIRLADADGIERYQWITSAELAQQHSAQLGAELPEQVWFWSEIRAGIPHITLATQEKFVPQMINYELLGGVNFKKGCYPGQEIVARSQYLGKQKRRMVLARIDSKAVASGMEVFASDDFPEENAQPCGMIVNAEPNGAQGCDCLIEIKLSYLNANVQLSSGEHCQWLAMPYPLPTEVEAG